MSFEDPSVNGPDYMPGVRWADDIEPSSDDLCTCDMCGDEYEVWNDPADNRPVSWCCEPCWKKADEAEHLEIAS